MNINASGRAASIIAAAFWVCMSCPLQAAEESDGGAAAAQTEAAPGAPVALSKFRKSRHWTHASSRRKPVRVASRGLAKSSKPRASEKKKTVELAAKDAEASDAKEPVVLLSPACASYDQYRNFEIRGTAFRDAVLALPGVTKI